MFPGGRRVPASLLALVIGILGLAGCGGGAGRSTSTSTSSASSPGTVAAGAASDRGSVCRRGYAAVLARPGRVSVGRVRLRPATGGNAEPECRVSAGAIRAVVNVDGSPQPYQRLERTIVEDGQQFGTQRNFSPPEAVSGVGLDAAWIPSENQLITADHRHLITVTLLWPHTRETDRVQLARSLARIALGT